MAVVAGTVTIAAGAATGNLPVTINGDTTVEPDETFTVTITGATNATIGTATATGTILNDDVVAPIVPVVSVGNASIVEGNAGTSVMNFPVTLSSAAPAGGVTITYSTANGTATAGSDYVAVVAGTVTIAQGANSGNLPVTINGDTTVEPDETFTVTIGNATNATLGTAIATGTILNDDVVAPVIPVVSVGNASIVEGNAGTSVLNFPVTLSSAAPAGGVTITYSTANATATAGSDYVAVVGGSVTIAAGGLTGNLPVTINGDTAVEPDETFTLTISAATNATLGTATATGTILNDDVLPPTVQTVQVPVNHPLALFALMLALVGLAWRFSVRAERRNQPVSVRGL